MFNFAIMRRKICFQVLFVMVLLLLPYTVTTQVQSQAQSINPKDILQGQRKMSIPFRFVNNFIILQVRLYGIVPAQLIFDTGAEHVIIFKREYTDVLGVEYDKRIPIIGSDLSRKIYALITRNALVEIGNLAPRPYDLLILEENYFNLEELIGTPVDGLIGGGFFKNLIVQIDYRSQRMTLHDPEHFQKPHGFVRLPVRIKTNKPYVDAEASLQDGTVVQVDLLVDTGAGVPLLLHNNSHPSLKLPEQYIRGRLGMGLGGYLEGYIGRINKLSIGKIDFSGVLTSFQDINEEWLVDRDRFRNGILGNQLLSRFNVFFDYIHSQMVLKPYRTKQKPFTMDRSGLVVFAYGLDFNQFIVKDVLPGSPAAEADIQPNDVLHRIQGFLSHYYELTSINSIFQKKVGKKISLILIRDGKKIKKEFYLRELV